MSLTRTNSNARQTVALLLPSVFLSESITMSTATRVLSAVGITRTAEKQYRINSPLRTGSDSNSFVITIDDDEHGAYFDHVTQETGTLWDLAKRLNVEITPKDGTESTSKRAYRDHHEYAAEKGVAWDVFAAAGWKPVVYMQRRALQIETANGVRYRWLDYADGDTYINVKKFTASLYRLHDAITMARAINAPLVYCNGEASTVIAQHHGVPAFSIAGGGERMMPESMLDEVRKLWRGDIIIALDCDKTGRMAAAKLARQFSTAGFNARAVDMQLGVGGDVADWCKLHTATSLQTLQALPAAFQDVTEEPKFKTIDALTLSKKTFAALNWIIKPIMPEGCYILAGKPKARKSWVATHIARAVALGEPVFGAYETLKGSVLYLDLESNERRMQSRLRLMDPDNKGQPANLHIATEWSRGETAVTDIEDHLIRHPDTVLVVVDILENIRAPRDKYAQPYTEDYNAVKPLNVLAEKYHCSILVLHHTRKSKSDDAFDEISGSTGLSGGVSGMYILSRLHADDAENKHSELLVRGRDIDADDKRTLVWNDALCRHDISNEYAAGATSDQRVVIELLTDNAHKQWRSAEIARAIQKSAAATSNLLHRMISAGTLTKRADGTFAPVLQRSYPAGYGTATTEPAPVPEAKTSSTHTMPIAAAESPQDARNAPSSVIAQMWQMLPEKTRVSAMACLPNDRARFSQIINATRPTPPAQLQKMWEYCHAHI